MNSTVPPDLQANRNAWRTLVGMSATSLTLWSSGCSVRWRRPRGVGRPPRAATPAAVLAMLALAAPDVVSTDRLVDGLWGEDPPSNPLGALQVYIHGVRKAFARPATSSWSSGCRPVTDWRSRPSRPTSVGSRASSGARATSACADDPAAAAATLEEALSLWRGPALADVRGAPFAEPEAVRLDELRLMAEEDSYDVRLALGEHAALVAELDRAVLEHPMRERFWGQLMTALYRSDRQADALATYARARDAARRRARYRPGPGAATARGGDPAAGPCPGRAVAPSRPLRRSGPLTRCGSLWRPRSCPPWPHGTLRGCRRRPPPHSGVATSSPGSAICSPRDRSAR